MRRIAAIVAAVLSPLVGLMVMAVLFAWLTACVAYVAFFEE